MAKTTMSKLEEALLRLTENVNRLEQESKKAREESEKAYEESKKAHEESKKAREESDERFKREIEISRQETDRSMRQLYKELGRLSNKMGTLVEDMVSPDMLRILRQIANIPEEVPGLINVRVKEFFHGANLNGHPEIIELDAIAECGNYVLINETKSTFRPEYVTDFLAKLAIVRDYFPEFQGKQIYAAIASLRIDPSVAKHAHDQGLLVLSLAEGMLEWQNPPGFVPKVF